MVGDFIPVELLFRPLFKYILRPKVCLLSEDDDEFDWNTNGWRWRWLVEWLLVCQWIVVEEELFFV